MVQLNPKYVNRGFTGGYRETQEGQEGDYRLLTEAEWQDLMTERDETMIELQRQKDKNDADNRKYRDNLHYVEQQRADAEAAGQKAMRKAERIKELADGDVASLKQRVKELANKQRGLARRAPGYYVVSVEENREPAYTYRTVVSTPWPVSMALGRAKRFCKEDLLGGLIGSIVEDTDRQDSWNRDAAERSSGKDGKPSVYQIRFKTGRDFWEAVIYHYGYIPWGQGGKGFRSEQDRIGEFEQQKTQKSSQRTQTYSQNGGFGMHM